MKSWPMHLQMPPCWYRNAILLSIGCFCYCTTKSEPVSNSPPDQQQKMVALQPLAHQNNPIELAKVEKKELAPDLRLIGSISYDEDHHALVGPLVAGRVTSIEVGMGDHVKAGQIMAIIESAEVGEAQAAYLAALANLKAAQANLSREIELSAQKISSQREKELAESHAASQQANFQASIERLRAMGMDDGNMEKLAQGKGTGGKINLRAPIAGFVVQRSITLGQAVERATDAFRILNTDRLWILLDLYEKDLRRIAIGQKAEIKTDAFPDKLFTGRVANIQQEMDSATRTAKVRIEVNNIDNLLRPGQFVTAIIYGESNNPLPPVLSIPRRAVVMLEGKSVVFVKKMAGFEKRHVRIGISDGELLEIAQGLEEGEEIAINGAFLLKSEALR